MHITISKTLLSGSKHNDYFNTCYFHPCAVASTEVTTDDPTSSITESFHCFVASCSGTLMNLTYKAWSPLGDATQTLTIYKNGEATALSATLLSDQTFVQNTTDNVSVQAGDLIAMQYTQSGTPDSSNASWTVELETAGLNV
jgi:hypothetical protein